MNKLSDKQIERQDFVDNSIYELICQLNPNQYKIEWDIEHIAEIREIIRRHIVDDLRMCEENEFYPFIDQ